MSPNGTVSFVGAGPGDPGLLTVRALERLSKADVVLYDALASAEVLACVRPGAQCFAVGKRAGTPCIAQGEINRMLVTLGRNGRLVVRLKGGDPAIFGRLAEEIEAVRAAGIAFEIVPGITTASAAVAGSKIPLTERGHARRVQIVTAHARAGEALALDWASLANPECTIVFYMGRAAANEIATQLQAHGLPCVTPVLLMTDVSLASEQRIIVPLSNLAEGAARLPSGPPMIAIIGSVVRLAVEQELERADAA